MIISKYKKIVLEPHEEAFIKENYMSLTNKELADSLGLCLTTLRYFVYNLGLKRIDLEYWTDEQITFLKANYKTIGDTELADIFEVKWFKAKGWTKKHMAKKRRYLKLKRTNAEIKTIKQRNKSMGVWKDCAKKRWETTGDMAPVGEKRLWQHSNNVFKVHIKTKQGFVDFNRWLWKQHFGPIPKGHVIRNNSSKLLDVTIEDLEMISMAENANINSKNRLPPYLKETQKLIKQVNNIIQQQS